MWHVAWMGVRCLADGQLTAEQRQAVLGTRQSLSVAARLYERDREEPMFLSKNPSKVYTYPCLKADLYNWQTKLGLDTSFTPHCLRVLGYNLSKAGNGVELTHGAAPHLFPVEKKCRCRSRMS